MKIALAINIFLSCSWNRTFAVFVMYLFQNIPLTPSLHWDVLQPEWQSNYKDRFEDSILSTNISFLGCSLLSPNVIYLWIQRYDMAFVTYNNKAFIMDISFFYLAAARDWEDMRQCLIFSFATYKSICPCDCTVATSILFSNLVVR